MQARESAPTLLPQTSATSSAELAALYAQAAALTTGTMKVTLFNADFDADPDLLPMVLMPPRRVTLITVEPSCVIGAPEARTRLQCKLHVVLVNH